MGLFCHHTFLARSFQRALQFKEQKIDLTFGKLGIGVHPNNPMLAFLEEGGLKVVTTSTERK